MLAFRAAGISGQRLAPSWAIALVPAASRAWIFVESLQRQARLAYRGEIDKPGDIDDIR